MFESGSELNTIAQPYVPHMYYIQSPDGIVRVDKEELGGNEGMVRGLVESVHALVQVVLKQHEVNHNETVKKWDPWSALRRLCLSAR